MNNMTRAEAICACTNALDLAECLDDRLPAQYFNSVSDKLVSMRDFIKDKWRSVHVSDKMHNAIHNMWDGLRRWDRDNAQNDDLFYGLSDPEFMAGADALPPDAYDKAQQAGKKGVESADVNLEGVSPEALDKLERMRQRAVARQPPAETPATTPQPSEHAAEPPRTPLKVQTPLITIEGVIRQREQLLSTVRTQFHEKSIEVVSVDTIKHGHITDVLRKTSSVRTKQLIEAAYCAGKITGVYTFAEALKDQAGE